MWSLVMLLLSLLWPLPDAGPYEPRRHDEMLQCHGIPATPDWWRVPRRHLRPVPPPCDRCPRIPEPWPPPPPPSS
jgi:hypothetical protein